MIVRLRRIEMLILALTAAAAAVALASRALPATGVAIGGGTALLDFVVIRRLASLAFVRRPNVTHVVPLALLKSVALIAIPAAALALPATLVDGRSFALGVTMLPLAIVIDACVPIPARA